MMENRRSPPPGNIFFHFFRSRNVKKGVRLPGIGIKNRFSTMNAVPSNKPPPTHWFPRSATEIYHVYK